MRLLRNETCLISQSSMTTNFMCAAFSHNIEKISYSRTTLRAVSSTVIFLAENKRSESIIEIDAGRSR